MTSGEIRNIGKLQLEKTRWLDVWQNALHIYIPEWNSTIHVAKVDLPFFLCPFYVSQHCQIRLWTPPDLAARPHQRLTKSKDKWKVVPKLNCTINREVRLTLTIRARSSSSESFADNFRSSRVDMKPLLSLSRAENANSALVIISVCKTRWQLYILTFWLNIFLKRKPGENRTYIAFYIIQI